MLRFLLAKFSFNFFFPVCLRLESALKSPVSPLCLSQSKEQFVQLNRLTSKCHQLNFQELKHDDFPQCNYPRLLKSYGHTMDLWYNKKEIGKKLELLPLRSCPLLSFEENTFHHLSRLQSCNCSNSCLCKKALPLVKFS